MKVISRAMGSISYQKQLSSLVLTASLLCAAPFPAPAAVPWQVLNSQGVPSLAPLLEKISPAVVNIATRGTTEVRNPLMDHPMFEDPFFRRFFGVPDGPQTQETQSLGSGVIVDARKGYILTNAHVIKGADEIKVNLIDEREFTAKVIGADEETDVALIQIEASNLTELSLADSDKARPGDFVVAIGNPFGLRHTVTSGIVSATGRSGIGDPDSFQDYIQTDASINPGNSGGALVNFQGELIGLNSAILSRSGGNIGIGFAIPSNIARQVMQQLIQYGEVKRGRLGVVVQNITPDLAKAFGLSSSAGVLVAQVQPGSAADKAGIKAEDVILSINGRGVQSYRDLRNTIGLLRVGDKLTLEIQRNGKRQVINTSVGEASELKEAATATAANAKLEGAQFGPAEDGNGVEVSEVKPQSPAARNGLRPGDVIIAINRRPVRSVAEFQRAVKGQDTLLVTLRRGPGTLFLVIK
ncbi:MAG TPA: DegQ family serine endoprotease [Candidatus Macondimonas sp.]|nr:DegQ family serine endoprotease [Candidatus Macondimonas sp.]